MSFVEAVRRARELLRNEGRLSLRALKREFELDDDALEELADELVEIQRVAVREGRALLWNGESTESRAKGAEQVAADSVVAERRQLTVLFCDLVDSTRLAAGMDAEDWRALVQRYHAAAGEVIGRFGGHVAQYLGDGVLAYFGWPRAHEDDAERAVRAGLGIVEAIGPDLSVRIGIHTGPVVVGEMGGNERRETLAMGDTTNVAARLQAIAEPGTVVLSSATLRLVSGIFHTRDLGEQELKGLAELVRVHQAVQASGVRSRLDVVAATELTPFIGREQELGLLEDRFAQVAEGNGQAVLIQGEAGIGKSRLVQAFRERIAERAHTWLECRGSAYTQDSAFHPVLELHRQGLGFRTNEAADGKLDRVAAGLQGVGFDPAETVPVIAALHGVPLGERFTAPNLSPEGMRKKTFALLTEWLLRLGQRQPLVLLLEDLHWMDPSTVELIGRVLEQVPTAPVLLLATYRPDFESPWGARSFLTPMLLSRFTRAQLADLVRKAARGRDLPDAWVGEILRRADGVPLFAEELTRTLLDQAPDVVVDGALPVHIPETLQDSLMARLDALGPVKELAQVGSVLGREFSYELLLAVSPLKESELQAALRSAVREELFYQRGTPPEATYLFKHALIRDAAYQSMLRTTRQRHHRRVAESLIARMPKVAEDQPELVAHHWGEAGDAETAIEWWIRAGERASERAVCDEAVTCARRGLALVEQLPEGDARRERELRLQMLLAGVLSARSGWAHAETMAAWQRARSLSQGEANLARNALITYRLWSGHQSGGNYPAALALSTELRQIQGNLQHPLFEYAWHHGHCATLMYLGRISESLATVEAAFRLPELDPRDLRAIGIEQPSLLLWGWRALIQWFAGFPDCSRLAVQQGLDQGVTLGNPYSRAYLTAWGAIAAYLRRDWSETRRLGLEARRLATEQGFPMLAAIGVFAEAVAAVKIDRDTAAPERYARAVEQARSAGNRSGATIILGTLVDLLLTLERLEEASRYLEGAFALSNALDERLYMAELLRLKGELALRADASGKAESLFREAIDTARSQQAKSLELRAATCLARLWRNQGKHAEARELLAPIYAWFTEGFDTLDLVEAKTLLGELS
jgi:predicted ATPase/class 3 adenylate cyclase